LDGVAVASGFGLGEEADGVGVGAGGLEVAGFVAGVDDDAGFFDAGGEDLLEEEAEDGTLFSVGGDEGLEGQGALLAARGGDDGFFDFQAVEGAPIAV